MERKTTTKILVGFIILIAFLIIYPYAKIKLKEKEKEMLKENINKVIYEVGSYVKKNNFDEDYVIFNIKDYKIVEEDLDLNNKLPENGKIYIDKDGNVKIVANDKNWCITKNYSDDLLNIEQTKKCEIIEVVKLANKRIALASNNEDGIYKVENNFYFKGTNPNNYLTIEDQLFRIIKIDDLGNIKIIMENSDIETYWSKDAKSYYSTIKENTIGYHLNNDETLKKWRTNSLFSENEYQSVNYKHYKSINDDTNKSTFFTNIFLPSVKDFVNTTINNNCKYDIYRNTECSVNNWMTSNHDYITSDISDDSVWIVGKEGVLFKSNKDIKYKIKPVFTLSYDVILQGRGTLENPYKIVIK